MIRQMLRPTVILAITSLLFLSCGPDLIKALPGEYYTDGELMVKSMESAVKKLADMAGVKGVVISTFENLEDTSEYDSTLVFDRLEDVFAQVFAERGMAGVGFSGGGEEKPFEEEKKEEEKLGNNPTIEGGISTEMEPGNFPTSEVEVSTEEEEVSEFAESNGGGEFTGFAEGTYNLKYRLLTCMVEYEKAPSKMMNRKATSIIHVRIEDVDLGEVVWAGEIRGVAKDQVPKKYVEALIDSRYEQITATKEEGGTNPFIEPLLVTAITGGLIYLFAVSARSE